MTETMNGRAAVSLAFAGSLLLAAGCAYTGPSGTSLPPAVTGTHTVMGRAIFPGGTMALVDAHLRDGNAWGTVEYSQVQSRGEIALRVFVDVACVGVFKDGAEAIVTGPVERADGDYEGRISTRDWWLVQIEEGGEEGDLLFSSRMDENRAMTLCQQGPDRAATLRAVEGDLSIH